MSKKLTLEQIGKLEDVIYTLNHGATKGWRNPKGSIKACIAVLNEVLNGTE